MDRVTGTESWRTEARSEFVMEIIRGVREDRFPTHTTHYLMVLLEDILYHYGYPCSEEPKP